MRSARATRPLLGVFAVAMVAFVMLGLGDGALGVAWPTLQTFFGRRISDLGQLLAFGSIGYLGASIGYGSLHSRLGTGRLLSGGSTLLACGLGGLAFAPAWPTVALSSVLVGLGGGLVDTGMNAHAALAFDVRSINLLHAAFGVGATLGPLVLALSLTTTGYWRAGYAALAVAQGISAALIWSRRRRWAGLEPDLSGDEVTSAPRLRLWMHLLLFFLYTGVELGTGQWAFTLLTEGRDLQTGTAGAWVAAYWGGLTLGRLGFGVVGDRMSPKRILDGSVVAALASLCFFWLDPWGAGVVALPLAGAGLAAIFPTLVSLTPTRIGRVRSTRSIGYQLAAATIGAASLPWLIGVVAESNGLESLGMSLFAAAGLLAVAHVFSERL